MHFLVTVAVLVYAPPGGGAAARRGEAQAALQAAARAGGAAVVDEPLAAARAAHRAGWAPEGEFAFFKVAAEAMAEGGKALARVELERAEKAFAQAEATYAPELARPGVRLVAAEAALWRGVALFELGRPGAAQAEWQRAVALEPSVRLTEAMVRPKVAQAFAEAAKRRATAAPEIEAPRAAPVATDDRIAAALDEAAARHEVLGAERVVVAAIAVDAGVLTYAATRREAGCGTAMVTATRADELLRRLDGEACRPEASLAVLEADAIAHPRAAPAGRVGAGGERWHGGRLRLWQRPWLWIGVVGAVGVGVVLAVSLWPRDATFSATADFHQFSLTAGGYSSTR